MANTTYNVILSSNGIRAFTMPDGFWPDAEIHCWGAGGGAGSGGALGGGGGYAKTTINIQQGDEVTLQIGQPGGSASGNTPGVGGLDTTYRRLRGGSGAAGGNGGGGGASFVAINGVMVCVAAGGGGGGASGGASGGKPGGSYLVLNTVPKGADSGSGGGGGAGFPFGGAAGGNGGQNYGNITLAGSGSISGGKTVTVYPGRTVGDSGSAGYVLIKLRKKLNITIKNANGSGEWTNVESSYVKTPATVTYDYRLQTFPATSVTLGSGSGSWTVPSGVTSINVIVQGGGGGGGGGHHPCGNGKHTGGSGGNGYENSGTLSVTPGQTISYSVGSGGAGGAKGSPGSPGSSGGSTTFGSISAAGGSGGGGGSGSGGGANGAGGTGRSGGAGGEGHPGETNGSSGSSGLIQIVWTPNPVNITTTRTGGGWRPIQQVYTKVNSEWKPILADRTIQLYNYPTVRLTANISIIADTDDYNLLESIPGTYFDGLMDLDVWVYPNVVITGNTTSTAFTVAGFSPGDRITLHNYGVLQGRGGDGGAGSYTYTVTTNPPKNQAVQAGKSTTTTAIGPARAGSKGGTGLVIGVPIRLQNAGTIAGGGGGGGGGGSGAGGLGGGGAGYGTGYNNGTLTSGGAGQNTTYDGGSGGGRGQIGAPGQSGAAGGAAGYAINGIGYLTTGSNTGSYIGPLA